MLRRAFLALAAPLMLGVADSPTIPVDPLTLADDDFARHRDPAEWRGLRVEQIDFTEGTTRWRLWRIANTARPKGPLWLVPHDNENGAFDAALVAVRAHGGTMVAIDSGVHPAHDGQRFNYAVHRTTAPVDPNRNFDSATPLYTASVLGKWRPEHGPLIALHTNQKGFDTRLSTCNRDDGPGNGVISIRFCDSRYTPRPSASRVWPFDDDDTLAYLPHFAGSDPQTAWCSALADTDFSTAAEIVTAVSDRSISNYAVPRGMRYLTLETLDSGLMPAALADQRDRLVAMIDHILALCPLT